MPPKKELSKADMAVRRERIAGEFRKLIDQGTDIDECYRRLSNKYDVTVHVIYDACRWYQIKVPRRLRDHQLPALTTLEIIADLIRGKKGIEIATERNLSRQRISQIKEQAEKAGLLDAVEQRVKAVRK
jgi:hypothetical protein